MTARPETSRPLTQVFDAAADVLKLLAEPTRLHILWLLEQRERSVTELVDITGVARTLVSQHLAKLRVGGLVSTRRVGRSVIYSVENSRLLDLVFESLNHLDRRTAHE